MLKPASVVRTEVLTEHCETLAAARRLAGRAREELCASAAYLFGSRARDDWHRGSDADVFVISACFADKKPWERPGEIEALWDGPVSLQAHGLTLEEWENARGKGGLVDMALHDGIVDLLAPETNSG